MACICKWPAEARAEFFVFGIVFVFRGICVILLLCGTVLPQLIPKPGNLQPCMLFKNPGRDGASPVTRTCNAKLLPIGSIVVPFWDYLIRI